MKLMAKMPEDRYQTAAGLQFDMQQCLASWQLKHRIEPFALGQHDAPDHLLIPERLFGREREVNELHAAFRRALSASTPQLVLISGYAGVGKSAVVAELQRMVLAENALLSTPFVNLALVPEAASSLLMPRTMGHQRAFSTLVMGRKVSAEDARLAGFVSEHEGGLACDRLRPGDVDVTCWYSRSTSSLRQSWVPSVMTAAAPAATPRE